jgi:hypothetical protein
MDVLAATNHEVHFPARFVSPIKKTFRPRPGAEDVQDKMLPEMTPIVVADFVPPPNEGRKSGVLAIYPLGLAPVGPRSFFLSAPHSSQLTHSK